MLETDDLDRARRIRRRNRRFWFIAIFLMILTAVIMGRTYA